MTSEVARFIGGFSFKKNKSHLYSNEQPYFYFLLILLNVAKTHLKNCNKYYLKKIKVNQHEIGNYYTLPCIGIVPSKNKS